MRKVVVGTRGSALSLKQVEIATRALQAADAELSVEVRIIVPRGDRDKVSPIPLDQIGKGWFSQEIEQELLDGTIDIAVHSLKDLQQELPKGLAIGAYLPREDARDVLITKNGEPLEKLRQGAVIGTDSLRRQVQMLALKPDAAMKSLRGNVPNRVQKLHDEEYDAIILAAAGLKRLDMADRITRFFEPEEMTPAPGQGIIAIETRGEDAPMLQMLEAVNDAQAMRAFGIESAFSRIVGGGCKAPTGAYARFEDGLWHVVGMIADEDGTHVRFDRETGEASDAENMGSRMAERMLAARA